MRLSMASLLSCIVMYSSLGAAFSNEGGHDQATPSYVDNTGHNFFYDVVQAMGFIRRKYPSSQFPNIELLCVRTDSRLFPSPSLVQMVANYRSNHPVIFTISKMTQQWNAWDTEGIEDHAVRPDSARHLRARMAPFNWNIVDPGRFDFLKTWERAMNANNKIDMQPWTVGFIGHVSRDSYFADAAGRTIIGFSDGIMGTVWMNVDEKSAIVYSRSRSPGEPHFPL